jgi:hypothetical protein
VQADGGDSGPVPVAFGVVLDDEAHGVDVDLTFGQLPAQGRNNRLVGLLGCCCSRA